MVRSWVAPLLSLLFFALRVSGLLSSKPFSTLAVKLPPTNGLLKAAQPPWIFPPSPNTWSPSVIVQHITNYPHSPKWTTSGNIQDSCSSQLSKFGFFALHYQVGRRKTHLSPLHPMMVGSPGQVTYNFPTCAARSLIGISLDLLHIFTHGDYCIKYMTCISEDHQRSNSRDGTFMSVHIT